MIMNHLGSWSSRIVPEFDIGKNSIVLSAERHGHETVNDRRNRERWWMRVRFIGSIRRTRKNPTSRYGRTRCSDLDDHVGGDFRREPRRFELGLCLNWWWRRTRRSRDRMAQFIFTIPFVDDDYCYHSAQREKRIKRLSPIADSIVQIQSDSRQKQNCSNSGYPKIVRMIDFGSNCAKQNCNDYAKNPRYVSADIPKRPSSTRSDLLLGCFLFFELGCFSAIGSVFRSLSPGM